jgi:putative flippase GtrA
MQFFLYLIVGGLSFFVDIGTFLMMRTIEVPVIPASVTSFSLATAANYLLCIVLAFEHGRFRRSIEMLRFLSVVLVGLGFNTLLVWCFVFPLSIHPATAKIAAVPVVLIWNYLGRRLFVFSNDIPVAIGAWLDANWKSATGLAPIRTGLKAEPAVRDRDGFIKG